jgi:hypothetical protein
MKSDEHLYFIIVTLQFPYNLSFSKFYIGIFSYWFYAKYTLEAEARGPQVRGQLGLHCEFGASLGYLDRPCVKINKREK